MALRDGGADPAIYATHSLDQNVNLNWSAIFALFGAVMLTLAAKAKKTTTRD